MQGRHCQPYTSHHLPAIYCCPKCPSDIRRILHIIKNSIGPTDMKLYAQSWSRLPQTRQLAFEDFQLKVGEQHPNAEEQSSFHNIQMEGPGNTMLVFHGTRRTCTLGEGDTTLRCTYEDCRVCRIIENKFVKEKSALHDGNKQLAAHQCFTYICRSC